MTWIEQTCRWSLAYAYLDWAFLRPHRGRRDWQAPLHAYALALGLDPEEGR